MKIAAWLCAAAAATCHAGDANWYTQIANDVVFGTDRWYTSGVRIAREKDGVEWGLVQDIYTPEAKRWHPGVDDRKPTARLLASGAMHDRGDNAWQTFAIELGVRGPSALGRQSTQDVHHLVPAPEVDWSRQLDDSVDANGVYARTQSIATGMLKLHLGANLGTQVTFAHVGFELRAGDTSLASPALRFAPTPPMASGTRGWSAYVGASERGVARNELLSGNYDPLGGDLTMRHAVTRIAAGIAWMPRWGALAFDVVQDGREFTQQRLAQRYGILSVLVAF